jgi:ribosomal-protein-alanine N-acetyltransferase
MNSRGRDVETRRLHLRPFTIDDLIDHTALYIDPAVTRYLPQGPFVGPEVEARSRRAVEHFVRHWERHGFGVWAVTDRTTGRLLGQCGLNRLPGGSRTGDGAPTDVEVLYALERAAWGAGLATEAARAALAHGFDRVGLERIVALAHPGNLGSRRVMEKLGMRLADEIEAFGMRVVCYAITRETFREAR